MSDQNLDLTRAIYAAFAKGDIPYVLGMLTPDGEWTEAKGFPYTGTYVGPQAVLDGVFMRLGSEWERFTAVPEEFLPSGDTVVVIGTYAGTYKATGKSFEAAFVHVWRFRDGKVYKFNQHVDTHLVQQALQ